MCALQSTGLQKMWPSVLGLGPRIHRNTVSLVPRLTWRNQSYISNTAGHITHIDHEYCSGHITHIDHEYCSGHITHIDHEYCSGHITHIDHEYCSGHITNIDHEYCFEIFRFLSVVIKLQKCFLQLFIFTLNKALF